MARTTITQEGMICFRTKLMPLSLASSFARCLQGNETRFCDVAIVPSKSAEKFFVQFRPVNPDRQGDLYEAQYAAREQRGKEQADSFIFWPDPDFPGSYWCFSEKSGETYQTQIFSCSCPDYQFRCKNAGLKCKHQHALQVQADAGLLGKTDKVTRTADDRAALAAKCLANRELDW